MTERIKRRRLGRPPKRHYGPEATILPGRSLVPATVADRRTWNGFCEIESEPALFNVILREFGVRGIKVHELVSLEEEMMAFVPKPIYGLIFLFRWREDDPDKQEASCPDGVWFANQTSNNACASVALLNIVNNVEGIELGEHLRRFKDFTMPFTPALRGDAITNFEFVKQIHNSFARKMDMLNSDLQLKNDATAKRKKAGKHRQEHGESEAGFHFIAFVPAMGKVWKFDGLERQPQGLGQYSEDNWLDLVKPEIRSRMTEYEEGRIEFSVLSLVRDPILDIIRELALNVKCLETVIRQLDEGIATSDHTFANLPDVILGPALDLGLTQEDIDCAEIPQGVLETYQASTLKELDLLQRRLIDSQRRIRESMKEELQSCQADDDHAAGRRHEYGPAVRSWIGMLARKAVIKDLLDEFPEMQ